MAYDIEALQRTINSKWRTWSASQRKEAERMYAQAVEANAKEEAENARKKGQRDSYTQQTVGTIAGTGLSAYGTYLATHGGTGVALSSGGTALGAGTGGTIAGAGTTGGVVAGGTGGAVAGGTGGAVAGSTGGSVAGGTAAGAGSYLTAAAPYMPYVAAALTAYLAAKKMRGYQKQGIKPASGDYTEDEFQSVVDPGKLYGIDKYRPKIMSNFERDVFQKYSPGYQAFKKLFVSSKHPDQVKRDRVRSLLEKEGFAEKQGKTHFIQLADGSYADIGHEDQVDAQGNSYKNYNLDVNDPLKQQSLALVNPIAHMFGGGDQKVSSDTAGILTNAFTTNAKNVDDVRANILTFLSKKGLSTEDIRANLQTLKDNGRISDEHFNVFSADLNKITDGLPASPIVNEQQVGAAPVQATAPVEAAKPLGQETPADAKKPFAPLENVNQNQAGFLKDQSFQPASNPFLQPSTSPGLMDLGAQTAQQAMLANAPIHYDPNGPSDPKQAMQYGLSQVGAFSPSPNNSGQMAQPFAGSLVGRGGVLTPNQPLVKPQGITIDPYRDPNNAGLIGLGQTQTPGIVRR